MEHQPASTAPETQTADTPQVYDPDNPDHNWEMPTAWSEADTTPENTPLTEENGTEATHDTPEENEISQKLQTTIGDKLYAAAGNLKFGIDHALNVKDVTQQKVLLLNRRESRIHKKTARLEAKLKTVQPGSRRAIRLERSLGYAKHDLNRINGRQQKITGRIVRRGEKYDDQFTQSIVGKELNYINSSREKTLAKMQVALEKKRRRAIEKNARRTVDSRTREHLIDEMKQWPSIKDFEAALMQKIEKKFHPETGGSS